MKVNEQSSFPPKGKLELLFSLVVCDCAQENENLHERLGIKATAQTAVLVIIPNSRVSP